MPEPAQRRRAGGSRAWRALLLAVAVANAANAANAVAAVAAATDAGVAESALERHVTEVAEQLRCLVCQNQSIADSHAQLALDLKQKVREQLAQGSDERQVIDFMVQRYGDFVLYRPPFKPATWLLWLGPFLLLAGGLLALLLNLRRRQRAGADAFEAWPEQDPDDDHHAPFAKEIG
jgi:cytochrome c-type biogenesis protein CcmH